jgi:hypothetical protein
MTHGSTGLPPVKNYFDRRSENPAKPVVTALRIEAFFGHEHEFVVPKILRTDSAVFVKKTRRFLPDERASLFPGVTGRRHVPVKCAQV